MQDEIKQEKKINQDKIFSWKCGNQDVFLRMSYHRQLLTCESLGKCPNSSFLQVQDSRSYQTMQNKSDKEKKFSISQAIQNRSVNSTNKSDKSDARWNKSGKK